LYHLPAGTSSSRLYIRSSSLLQPSPVADKRHCCFTGDSVQTCHRPKSLGTAVLHADILVCLLTLRKQQEQSKIPSHPMFPPDIIASLNLILLTWRIW
jgi:hypothetical protein